ncbi:MAG: DUF1844 domain-containing protein [Planctomycetota bacterium]|jgi:hypothetical protein
MTEENKPNDEQPKIIVDDDWKAQAQAEKQKLAEQEKAAAEAGPAAERQIPPASFEVLVSSLVTQIMFALGAVPDPRTNQRYVDLDIAKHHIDMLSVLDEKTKGNLSDEEAKLLDQALYECRMHYVQISNTVANQMAGGAPGGPGAPGTPEPGAS